MQHSTYLGSCDGIVHTQADQESCVLLLWCCVLRLVPCADDSSQGPENTQLEMPQMHSGLSSSQQCVHVDAAGLQLWQQCSCHVNAGCINGLGSDLCCISLGFGAVGVFSVCLCVLQSLFVCHFAVHRACSSSSYAGACRCLDMHVPVNQHSAM